MGDFPYGKPLRPGDRPRGTRGREVSGTIRQDEETGEEYFRPGPPRITQEPRKHSKDKPKGPEFLKIFTVTCVVIAVFVVVGMVIMNFILLWNDKTPMQQEVITAVQIFGGMLTGAPTLVYGILNGVRAWSYNKHVDGPCSTRELENGGV